MNPTIEERLEKLERLVAYLLPESMRQEYLPDTQPEEEEPEQ